MVVGRAVVQLGRESRGNTGIVRLRRRRFPPSPRFASEFSRVQRRAFFARLRRQMMTCDKGAVPVRSCSPSSSFDLLCTLLFRRAMTDYSDTPSIAAPALRAPSHRPAASQRNTTQRRPPTNIAGPTNNSYTPPPANPTRRNTAGEVVSEDQIQKKKGADAGKAAVWGLGGVFPQREEKRGLHKQEKEEKRGEQENEERDVSAPTEMEWPASERADPFSASTSPASAQQHDEAESPTNSATEPRSESSTVCEEQPRREGKSSADDEDHGQVGGELPQDGEWEDEMDKQDGDPPVNTVWGSVRFALREPLAEFLGMLIVIALGIGANCQVKISQDSVSCSSTNRDSSGRPLARRVVCRADELQVDVNLGVGGAKLIKCIFSSQAGTYSNMNFVWGMAVMVGICESALSLPHSFRPRCRY